ncbi:MAG: HEPN domain-containing protein [Treponema sp.]|nr:HEPN domain-containing protein [Treponema sp.]
MDIKEVAEWLFIADEDLKSAEYLNSAYKPNKEAIYYHCSQSVEKYLKGYLRYNNIKFDYDHNLSKLIALCEKNDKSFNYILTNCNQMNVIISKLRYPSRIDLDDNDVLFALTSSKNTKILKPIQNIRNIIESKYGISWQEILFNKQDPEKIESIGHIKYDKTEDGNIAEKLKNITEIIHLENISGLNATNNKIIIDKYKYNSKNDKYYYLLIRMNYNNNICEAWHFNDNFNKLSAIGFLKQYDEQQGVPTENSEGGGSRK